MKTQITLEPGRGILLTDEMQRAAGILPGQVLSVSIEPGEIRITKDENAPKIVQRGKHKIISGGEIPEIPIPDAVRMARDEIR